MGLAERRNDFAIDSKSTDIIGPLSKERTMTPQTRSPRPSATWRLAAAIAGVAVIATGLGACSANSTQTSASSSANSEAHAVEIREAGVEVDIAEFVGKNLVGGVIGGGGAQLFKLLSDAIGLTPADPNAQRFQEVKAQLDGIEMQLGQMQSQVATLTSKYDEGEYAADLRQLETYGNYVHELYVQKFQSVVEANQKLVSDKAAGASAATLQQDRDAIKVASDQFRSAFDSTWDANDALDQNIHDYLVPGATSVLAHKGAVLMDKGYLTAADSQELRAEYKLWSDYEALAAMMAAFDAHLSDPNGGAEQTKLAEWNANREAEQAALPPSVGVGTVVLTPNGTTKSATIYTPSNANGLRIWLPFDANGQQLGDSPNLASPESYNGGAPSVISPIAKLGEGDVLLRNDWRMWSDADAKTLVASLAGQPGATVGARLSALATATDPNNTAGEAENWRALADGHLWTTGISPMGVVCNTINDPDHIERHWYGDTLWADVC
jgi:hypothetical protein